MGQEVVAVALQSVADELHVVAVGDVADALGQERVLDLDLLEPDRPLLAHDLGKLGDLVDQSRWVVRRIVKAKRAPSGSP